jgi:hypothetical protein
VTWTQTRDARHLQQDHAPGSSKTAEHTTSSCSAQVTTREPEELLPLLLLLRMRFSLCRYSHSRSSANIWLNPNGLSAAV